MEQIHVKIPGISNIDSALKIYYMKQEIGNNEIRELFGREGRKWTNTLCKLRKLAKNKQAEQGVMSYGYGKVNTKCAFEAWGIDVSILEASRKRLIDLKLIEAM